MQLLLNLQTEEIHMLLDDTLEAAERLSLTPALFKPYLPQLVDRLCSILEQDFFEEKKKITEDEYERGYRANLGGQQSRALQILQNLS